MSRIKIYPEYNAYDYKLQFDGCSKGNPGLAGSGAVIYKNNIEIWSSHLFVSDSATNNQAEYEGLIMGLKSAIDLKITELLVEGDSMLVIKQMRGEYKVKSPNMAELYEQAKQLEKGFTRITFQHVYRNDNKRADELSNIAILKKCKNI
jgi:ribonuclease HI